MERVQFGTALRVAIGRKLQNVGNIVVGNEKVGIGAFKHHHGERVVGLQFLYQCHKLLIQGRRENIDGWVIDGDVGDILCNRHVQ